MGIAGLVVAVDHHYLGFRAPDDGHQPLGGLLREERGGETVGIGVGLRPGHARVPVAEQDDIVVADDLGDPGQLTAADVGQSRWTSGVSRPGLRISPSSPPVQQTSTVCTPSAW